MGPTATAIVVILVILVIGYFAIKKMLDDRAQNQLSIKPILGMCPTGWEKLPLAGGDECTRPNSSIFVDKCLNHIGSAGYPCTTPVSHNGIKYCYGIDLMKSDPSLYAEWCLKSGSRKQVLTV